jgi:hypothetical protein
MTDQPPTLDYQKPGDHYQQRKDAPRPKLRRRWVLLCWLPPVAAVLASGVIAYCYGSVVSMPRAVYNTQQWLLFLAFWWVALASLIRLVGALVRSV